MSASSPRHRPPLAGEDLVLALLCTAAGPVLWWIGSAGLRPGARGGLQLVENAVASACAGAGVLVATWWLLALAGALLASVGHRVHSVRLARWGRGLSPAFLRRVAASVLGVNLVLAPGAWAGEAEPAPPAAVGLHGPGPRVSAARPPAALPPGGPPPTWAAAAVDLPEAPREVTDPPHPGWRPAPPPPPVPGATLTARGDAAAPRSVTVRAGDCLWDIAAEELGPYATDLEIDRRWRQWYGQNRAVIGPDAGLLVPGTILAAPPVS
ncbi:hypothetical protein E7744_05735 [Citricoccus sp. SGAir0253]|uniref:LysM peptidoglycan-binding domain-containing protein n=1 Tax=Citricoccus sp. SGAir0253 TaxID=2567881 RepID=UPI0010CD2298|nr:hypothetical protein [Citricoccus sp. SGAir0253]QCU77753.1 hypothetical protein E7744_05735 [Citricoccus sp. SGAir0253]